jgi:hypothetical protein
MAASAMNPNPIRRDGPRRPAASTRSIMGIIEEFPGDHGEAAASSDRPQNSGRHVAF